MGRLFLGALSYKHQTHKGLPTPGMCHMESDRRGNLALSIFHMSVNTEAWTEQTPEPMRPPSLTPTFQSPTLTPMASSHYHRGDSKHQICHHVQEPVFLLDRVTRLSQVFLSDHRSESLRNILGRYKSGGDHPAGEGQAVSREAG